MCAGKMEELRRWFDGLIEKGKNYGYFPDPLKCELITKEGYEDVAEKYFGDLGVKIVYASRYLGGFIGRVEEVQNFLHSKVDVWKECIGF
mmetsp:Transcript_28475/g.37233  ORF Transcript_28475/g.37233 Transcript_28475/m.37233 type:complete len:90 (-) Transcript_28475:681-950(-)